MAFAYTYLRAGCLTSLLARSNLLAYFQCWWTGGEQSSNWNRWSWMMPQFGLFSGIKVFYKLWVSLQHFFPLACYIHATVYFTGVLFNLAMHLAGSVLLSIMWEQQTESSYQNDCSECQKMSMQLLWYFPLMVERRIFSPAVSKSFSLSNSLSWIDKLGVQLPQGSFPNNYEKVDSNNEVLKIRK